MFVVDFGIQVLTQGQWPYPQSGTLALPTEVSHFSFISSHECVHCEML